MNLRFFFLILMFFSCSFDGGKVKNLNDFLKEKREIINLKLIQCGMGERENKENSDNNLLLLLLFPESSFYELGLFKSHVTNKDAHFCYDALYSVQCGRTAEESAQNIITTNLLYCNPKSACMGDKQNLGQGELCISGE
ncbi:hypothetical protein ND861_06875 [Leptospira sp. 2 VSF19]|uniref:Lipoprotein n=1 Tax=Leptospira soteropolitanensis TaxID=2950025 RepID=A0AAW5VL40_9LEPT|nr:hypothetical protein [Leptospira soteropolitanensis]MCW7492375.1 hypothetical protein [Leptospira soteropolitanensis]MCW7499956.1 hypothetical protein [Leptospira soteropolitanensis]MCW7522207.1 hypothetical protein [Leptospira soteropolitanensis]MCW7526062.1 hypothetical protein [Leptospira soteropolitanensis]MCW7529825.1 hypothetical protein [Leptospira soteropolitanensis]